jgi:hypothetical protein
MNRVARKWFIRTSLLLCLVTVSFALDRVPDKHKGKCKPHDDCSQQVPEGGSTAMYLLAAGLACVTAVSLRSRSAKTSIS